MGARSQGCKLKLMGALKSINQTKGLLFYLFIQPSNSSILCILLHLSILFHFLFTPKIPIYYDFVETIIDYGQTYYILKVLGIFLLVHNTDRQT